VTAKLAKGDPASGMRCKGLMQLTKPKLEILKLNLGTLTTELMKRTKERVTDLAPNSWKRRVAIPKATKCSSEELTMTQSLSKIK